MRRLRSIGLLGLVTLGLVLAFSMGNRPALRAQTPIAAVAASSVGGGFGDAQAEAPIVATNLLPPPPMTVAEMKSRIKLQEKLALNFPNETPLQEFLKYVRQNTEDKIDFPDGLPIYVDPNGLQDADKTTADTVMIELKGIPLATSLRLVLAQLHLAYWVNHDGLVIITANIGDDLPMDYEATVVQQLSSLRREVELLRGEIHRIRGLPGGGMGTMGGSVGGSMGGIGSGVR